VFGNDKRPRKAKPELPSDPTGRKTYVSMDEVYSPMNLLGFHEIGTMTAD
jgi:hypothetical protein